MTTTEPILWRKKTEKWKKKNSKKCLIHSKNYIINHKRHDTNVIIAIIL